MPAQETQEPGPYVDKTEKAAEMMDVDDSKIDNVDESTMSLPLSKIKRIFKMDPEYFGSSASAVFATGAATELFVQYLVEQASMNAKVDKRKKVQYKDVSFAVGAQEALYFLSDTVPRTQSVKEAVKGKKINLLEEDQVALENADKEEEQSAAQQESEVKAPSPVRKSAAARGQSKLPFTSEKDNQIKRANLSDLMSQDDKVTESDAMVVDS